MYILRVNFQQEEQKCLSEKENNRQEKLDNLLYQKASYTNKILIESHLEQEVTEKEQASPLPTTKKSLEGISTNENIFSKYNPILEDYYKEAKKHSQLLTIKIQSEEPQWFYINRLGWLSSLKVTQENNVYIELLVFNPSLFPKCHEKISIEIEKQNGKNIIQNNLWGTFHEVNNSQELQNEINSIKNSSKKIYSSKLNENQSIIFSLPKIQLENKNQLEHSYKVRRIWEKFNDRTFQIPMNINYTGPLLTINKKDPLAAQNFIIGLSELSQGFIYQTKPLEKNRTYELQEIKLSEFFKKNIGYSLQNRFVEFRIKNKRLQILLYTKKQTNNDLQKNNNYGLSFTYNNIEYLSRLTIKKKGETIEGFWLKNKESLEDTYSLIEEVYIESKDWRNRQEIEEKPWEALFLENQNPPELLTKIRELL